jgi:hypothetical protein
MSENKLHLLSRRGFLKGLAGVTALATLPFLRSTGAGTDLLAPAFDTKTLDFMPTMEYKPLEVVTINPDGTIIEDESQSPEEYETALIRSLLLAKGYDLHARLGNTIGYRYMSASSTSSVNYLRGYSFKDVCSSIDKLRTMHPMTPQAIEKAHKAKFGNSLYNALYESPNTLRKSYGHSLSGGDHAGLATYSGLTAEQQVAFVSLPGVANLGAGVNSRSYSGFAEGTGPNLSESDPFFKQMEDYKHDLDKQREGWQEKIRRAADNAIILEKQS